VGGGKDGGVREHVEHCEHWRKQRAGAVCCRGGTNTLTGMARLGVGVRGERVVASGRGAVPLRFRDTRPGRFRAYRPALRVLRGLHRRRFGSDAGPVRGAQFRADVALWAHLTGSVQEPVVWRCACRRGSERRRIRVGSRGATSRLRLGRPDQTPGPSGAFVRGPGCGVCATASRKAPVGGFAAVQAADGGCLAARMATAMERAQQRARRSGNAVRSSLGKNHVVSRRDKKRLKRPGPVQERAITGAN
jgi:hypothetical protein